MRRRSREIIRKELKETRARLEMYLDHEARMLEKNNVQMYSIGSRKIQRYQMELADIQAMIDRLRRRIRELEAELEGQGSRRAVGVVPRDW